MDIIFLLLPASLVLALIALAGFLWSSKSGQFEDLDTPARRMLLDDQTSFDRQQKVERAFVLESRTKKI